MFPKWLANAGSHTIGHTHCNIFNGRLYNETEINTEFATSRRTTCPLRGEYDNLSSLDATTPTKFDATYYKDLAKRNDLLYIYYPSEHKWKCSDGEVSHWRGCLRPRFYRDHAENSHLRPLTRS